jgi:hypothetical protein
MTSNSADRSSTEYPSSSSFTRYIVDRECSLIHSSPLGMACVGCTPRCSASRDDLASSRWRLRHDGVARCVTIRISFREKGRTQKQKLKPKPAADPYGSLGLDIPEAPRGGPRGEAGMARQKRHLPQRGRAGGSEEVLGSLSLLS